MKTGQPGSSQNFKTVACKYFESGNCKYGDNCTYAHGNTELKPKPAGEGQDNHGYDQVRDPFFIQLTPLGPF